MTQAVIHVRASRQEIRQRVRLLAAILSGKAPDQDGIARGFGLRIGTAFLSLVKQAFVVKSRGGTDEAGISWPPLTKEYLAYGRRFGSGEQAALKRAAGLGPANRFAPGGNKGLLNAAQLKRWNQVYAKNLAWLAARDGIAVAKGAAAAIAWSTLKREGAQTKLEVYGNRQADILKDTGVLLNSLTVGEVSGEIYSPPPGQILETRPGEVIVGTNVEYAKYHHFGKKRRQLWPEASQVPQSWWQQIIEAGTSGLARAVMLVVGKAA